MFKGIVTGVGRVREGEEICSLRLNPSPSHRWRDGPLSLPPGEVKLETA